MKVLLLSDVYKHGVAGEIVDVADGFARNWLMPKRLAVKATPGALKQAANLRAKAEARRMQLDERLNDLARQIDGTELIFARRASPTGRLFGSVTTAEMADALNEKTGIDINRRRISQQTLRDVGTHEVPVRLGSETSPTLKITIVREEEYARFLREREAAAAQPETLGEVVAELAGAVAQGVTEAAEDVAGVVADAVEAVREVLPGQPAEDADSETSDETAAAE